MSGPTIQDEGLGVLGGDGVDVLSINQLSGIFSINAELFVDTFFPGLFIGGRLRAKDILLPNSNTPADRRPDKTKALAGNSGRVR